MDLLLPPLVVGDVDQGGAADAQHEQDGDDGEDHEDDEGRLTQLDQEKDVVRVPWSNRGEGRENISDHLTSV